MDFKEDFTILTLKKHFIQYGLIDIGWKFSFNNSKRSCGLCSYVKKVIYISNYYISSKTTTLEDIENAILHEIAHALTPGEKHGKVWKAKAIEIGCSGERWCEVFCDNYKYYLVCEDDCKIGIKQKMANGYKCRKHKKLLILKSSYFLDYPPLI